MDVIHSVDTPSKPLTMSGVAIGISDDSLALNGRISSFVGTFHSLSISPIGVIMPTREFVKDQP